MAWLPKRQSWATWALTISMLLSPMIVASSSLQRPVDGDVLANGVARADQHPAGVLGQVNVLGQAAEHGPLEDQVVAAQRRARLDDHPAIQPASAADRRRPVR